MAKKGKNYLEAAKQVDATKAYTVEEAIDLVKKVDFANSMHLLKLHIV